MDDAWFNALYGIDESDDFYIFWCKFELGHNSDYNLQCWDPTSELADDE